MIDAIQNRKKGSVAFWVPCQVPMGSFLYDMGWTITIVNRSVIEPLWHWKTSYIGIPLSYHLSQRIAMACGLVMTHAFLTVDSMQQK